MEEIGRKTAASIENNNKKFRQSRIVQFLENTSFHGFCYIADQQASKYERLFWMMVCGWCIVGMYFLFVATWRVYKSSPISFVTETTYLNWNTSFPAVAVCEVPGEQKIEAFADYVKGTERHGLFTNFLNELFLYSGSGCQICENQCPKQPGLCDVDINSLVNQYYAPCDELIINCSWNDDKIDCCTHFKLLLTQLGPCYVFNSMQTNGKTGPGTIKFQLEEKADVSILATDEVPFIHRSLWQHKLLEYGINHTARLQVTEIANDPLVREVPVDQRACRFPDEIDHTKFLYPRYSFSTCVINCIAEQQMERCGCIHHFLPTSELFHCNVSGLSCLNNFWDGLNDVQMLEAPYSYKGTNRTCDCLPSCTESEFELVMEQSSSLAGSSSYYALSMENLPTSRYIRNVVRTPLDLVVSLGGATGLFLGASLISVVELFYYFLLGQRGLHTNTIAS